MIASTAEHIRIELETPWLLAETINAVVSVNWPSGEYDRDALEFFLSSLESGGENAQGWYGWYAINTDIGGGQRALVGAGGYFGPPDAGGVVEIGYSVLPEWQRRGFATEMVGILVANAISNERVSQIIAHTSSDNIASICVLNSCGFEHAGAKKGILRFEHSCSTIE
jgi:RimJ/RimL family protein N-acetyltransferase